LLLLISGCCVVCQMLERGERLRSGDMKRNIQVLRAIEGTLPVGWKDPSLLSSTRRHRLSSRNTGRTHRPKLPNRSSRYNLCMTYALRHFAPLVRPILIQMIKALLRVEVGRRLLIDVLRSSLIEYPIGLRCSAVPLYRLICCYFCPTMRSPRL
jgi:hypothetical protein